MDWNNLIYLAIAALILGVVILLKSNKQRTEQGEWGEGVQWGYLISLAGVFGVLSILFNFGVAFFVLTIITGALWLWRKMSVAKTELDNNHFRDYLSGCFPIIAVIFVLRSFVAEPFQIPSSSMRPGLVVGDFILVNKFAYGIRTPVANSVLIPTGQVERGDVVVFHYPENPSVVYIKRAVGVAGDLVEYKNKQLWINGSPVEQKALGTKTYWENTKDGEVEVKAQEWVENWQSNPVNVLQMDGYPSFFPQGVRPDFAHRENCEYSADGMEFSCRVPEGYYFMMGDNRDNSEDSRYWGFVKEEYIVGKAFFIWLNFKELGRIGTIIR